MGCGVELVGGKVEKKMVVKSYGPVLSCVFLLLWLFQVPAVRR